METKIKLAIIDDFKCIQEAITKLFLQQAEMTVVTQAESGIDFFREQEFQTHDMVIIDMATSAHAHDDTLRALQEFFPEIKVIVFTAETNPEALLMLMHKGAHGIISKTNDSGQIMCTINEVMLQGSSYPHAVSKHLFSRHFNPNRTEDVHTLLAELNKKDIDILLHLAQGHKLAYIESQVVITRQGLYNRRTYMYELFHLNDIDLLPAFAKKHITIIQSLADAFNKSEERGE